MFPTLADGSEVAIVTVHWHSGETMKRKKRRKKRNKQILIATCSLVTCWWLDSSHRLFSSRSSSRLRLSKVVEEMNCVLFSKVTCRILTYRKDHLLIFVPSLSKILSDLQTSLGHLLGWLWHWHLEANLCAWLCFGHVLVCWSLRSGCLFKGCHGTEPWQMKMRRYWYLENFWMFFLNNRITDKEIIFNQYSPLHLRQFPNQDRFSINLEATLDCWNRCNRASSSLQCPWQQLDWVTARVRYRLCFGDNVPWLYIWHTHIYIYIHIHTSVFIYI